MPTKAKPAKKKAPAAKAKKPQKPQAKIDLAAELKKISGRIKALEKRAPVAGPPGLQGEPGPQGPQGLQGEPADMARIDALERRIAELEAKLAPASVTAAG